MSSANLQFSVPAGGQGVRAARDAISAAVRQWGFTDPGWVYEICAVTTELVNNAVCHGGGCRGVALSADDASVTVHVTDSSPAEPRQRPGAYGLAIVAAFARAFDTTRLPAGKRVWATMRPCPAIRA
ncbi:hypothetical protein Cme02nite_01440 [Catellatospora methionotrophica]|uniref:Histidine kinase/HSP90-like ATPase domain-containing protein n=1 Tax=Catellatospora methionotrophica TaxID=121620 RepID=A0A8J3L482_9ACTN|nr:ATP-binding protein [Catellatospora methionotrophica]GIG11812.1 hypothetical protein Cme02nite_01440 [Catellatospora methionotrophica]